MEVLLNSNGRFCYQSKENNYPQTPFEECKYEQERIKIENLIDDDLEKSECDVSDNDETESDNGFNE